MIVTGAVATILHEEAVVTHHLGALCRNIAFALLGDRPGDEAFTCLEVVVKALRFVALTSVSELRIGRPLPYAIEHIMGIDLIAVEVETHEVCVQSLVLVVHLAGAEEIGHALANEDEGVLRLISDDVVEALRCSTTTLLPCKFLSAEAIGREAVRRSIQLEEEAILPRRAVERAKTSSPSRIKGQRI